MKVVNYLDATLYLNNVTYTRTANEINYVHVKSNHPPNIIKQIPASIQKRLSDLSSNEEIFVWATPNYAAALQRSGYDHQFQYTPRSRNQVAKSKLQLYAEHESSHQQTQQRDIPTSQHWKNLQLYE